MALWHTQGWLWPASAPINPLQFFNQLDCTPDFFLRLIWFHLQLSCFEPIKVIFIPAFSSLLGPQHDGRYLFHTSRRHFQPPQGVPALSIHRYCCK